MSKLIISGIIGTIGLIVLLAGVIVLTLFNGIIEKSIKKELPIVNGSDTFDRFKEVKSPVFMSFYVFHVQNTSIGTDFASMKPIEKGPYVFEEKRFKDDIKYLNESEFVIYNERKVFIFRADLSDKRLLNDSVTVINFPLLGLINNVGFFKLANLEKIIYDIRQNTTLYPKYKNELQLFINTTVGEILFDGIGYQFAGGTKFSVFYTDEGNEGKENHTYIRKEVETWMVYSGIKSMDNYLEIVEYADYKTIRGINGDLWHDKEYNLSCNVLRGTDGTQFSPSVKKEDRVYAFEPQLCRVVFLDYDSEVKVKDVNTYRFRIPSEYFDNARKSKNNKCYCNNPANDFEECSVSGVLDISYCERQSQGAPVVMSPPNFLYGGGYYNKRIGLKYSDETVTVENYGTYIDIEPRTGVVLRADRKIQVNVALTKSYAMTELNNLTEKIIVPVLWIREYGEASDDQIQELKDLVLNKIKLGMGLLITAIVIGVVLIIVAIIMYAFHKRESSYANKSYKK